MQDLQLKKKILFCKSAQFLEDESKTKIHVKNSFNCEKSSTILEHASIELL